MKTILLVDDDPATRAALSKLLKLRHCEVLEAGTLGEGIRAAEERPVDCVILDLSLPDSSVEDTLGAVGRFDRPPDNHVPVCVYTGVEDPALIKRILDNGATAVITKGSSADSIIEKIFIAMARHSTGDGSEEGREVWQNRRENYRLKVSPGTWFTTPKVTAGLLVAVVVHMVSVGAWFWKTAGDRALEKQKLEQTAAAVQELVKNQQATQTDVANLKASQQQIAAAQQVFDSRLKTQWDAVNGLRSDMNAGFNRLQDQNQMILKIMLEQQEHAPRK